MESHNFLTYLGAKCANTTVMNEAINFNKRFSHDLKKPPLAEQIVTNIVFVVTPGRAVISEGKIRHSVKGYRVLIGVKGTEDHYIHMKDGFFQTDQRDRLTRFFPDRKYRHFQAEQSENQFLG